jgi:hypothetical protein
MPNDKDPMGLLQGAGAAAQPANILKPPVREVDGYEFTLPTRLLDTAPAKRYGLLEKDLTFVFIEPTPSIEKSAKKFAGGDPEKFGERIMDMCLYSIGGEVVNLNQSRMDSWYLQIGTTGRHLVKTIYLRNFATVTDDDINAVEASKKAVTC